MVMARHKVLWDGGPVVGDGVSVLHTTLSAAPSFTGQLGTFFATIQELFPAPLTWRIPRGGDAIDELTGTLTGTWGTSGFDLVDATGAVGYAAGVGARVEWVTGTVRNGRRVRGSTFLCPLLRDQYATDGTLVDTATLLLQSAASTLASAAGTQFKVWSRPKTGIPGAAVDIVRGEVSDNVSWLRSRRV